MAINKDPEEPIAEFADLMVVGDIFAILPPLTEAIKARGGRQGADSAATLDATAPEVG